MKFLKRLLFVCSMACMIIIIFVGIVVAGHAYSSKQENLVQKGEKYPIVCFIDDDSGKYIPEIWGPIIDSTHIKMGFACITGFMEGEVPNSEVFEQMDSSYLRKLYNEGHDVYSHTFSHQEFYVDTVTTQMIDMQCRLSKEWMDIHGYSRNSDIIVYPGGLGRGRWSKNIIASYKHISKKDAKRDVVRKYYKYGVDAIGFKPNQEPLDNYSILRVNADTSSLTTLKSKVDETIETNGILVFMNHAYELHKDKQKQVDKILNLIAYCKDNNVEIMPLSAALQLRGNCVAIDDYVSPFCIYVSKNGFVRCCYRNIACIEAIIIIVETIILLLIVSVVLFRKKRI